MAQSIIAATAVEARSNRNLGTPVKFSPKGPLPQEEPVVYDNQEDWGSPTCPRPPQAQPLGGGTEFQDGDADLHLPYDPPKRQSHVSGSAGCIYAHSDVQEVQEVSALPMERTFASVPRLAIRSITEPVGFHQDSPPGSGMGQSEGSMRNQYVLNLLQALGAWIQFQFIKVLNNAIPTNHTSRNGYKHQRNVIQGAFDQDERSSTRGQQATGYWPIDIKMPHELYWEDQIDLYCYSPWDTHASPNPEPAVMEEPTSVMERAVILARNTRARNLYRFQRHSTGNCCGSPLLLWSLNHTTEEDAHHYKGTTDGTLCSEAQEGCGQIGFSLFRQHSNTLVHQEIRRHNLFRTIGDLRTDLFTLPENQNPYPSNIRSVTSEPCGCARLTDGADRMAHISEDIRLLEYTIWSTRCISVCAPPEHEAEPVLQLVSRPKRIGPECTSL
ncbi:hypothetical protein AYI70_g3816 [Smittium culicis]|uniref:Uncharacterized protein n=1 Tax=Smittium culicis TaxID=133412 RepID=A0A1R1Y1U4_9FUNG|nr:hypothetical protein AYI70_g3816 [Smittium culicis]